MAYAYGRPNLRDLPEPETPITIELNIPKATGRDPYGLDGLNLGAFRYAVHPSRRR